jgi:hypothetical protein
MVYTLHFFFSSKCSLFHNSNIFGSCIIHILYTGCANIKKNNSGAKRLTTDIAPFYKTLDVHQHHSNEPKFHTERIPFPLYAYDTHCKYAQILGTLEHKWYYIFPVPATELTNTLFIFTDFLPLIAPQCFLLTTNQSASWFSTRCKLFYLVMMKQNRKMFHSHKIKKILKY